MNKYFDGYMKINIFMNIFPNILNILMNIFMNVIYLSMRKSLLLLLLLLLLYTYHMTDNLVHNWRLDLDSHCLKSCKVVDLDYCYCCYSLMNLGNLENNQSYHHYRYCFDWYYCLNNYIHHSLLYKNNK